MALRCRELDLVVIRNGSCFDGVFARVLRYELIQADDSITGAPQGLQAGWIFENRVRCTCGCHTSDCGPDNELIPIRPQADDAQDESAAWLPPVPSTEKEPA